MAAGRYTSRVFVALFAVEDALSALSLPANKGKSPPVVFSDEAPEKANEYVTIRLNQPQSSIQWRRLSPPGADERIVVEVVARSFVPGVKKSRDVLLRLQEMSDAIQEAFYNHTTESIENLGFDGEVGNTLVTSVVPDVWPGEEGWVGEVVHTVDISAQI